MGPELEGYTKFLENYTDVSEQLAKRTAIENRVTSPGQLLNVLVDRGHLSEYQRALLRSGRHSELAFREYRIVCRIGEGGMGTVDKAYQVMLDRYCALKRISRVSDPAVLEYFRRECAILAKLEHPHIAKIYDAGVQDKIPFLVTELINGSDLNALVKAGGVRSIRDAISLTIDAASALSHVHALNIIHRDVKPHNLMLDKARVVKLVDLGLAKIADSCASDTKDIGTPAYAAPEQFTLGGSVDSRADIYGLGVTLWFLLVGSPPFGVGLGAVAEHHKKTPMPSLKVARPDVLPELARVFHKMTERRADDRYPDMNSVIAALKPLLERIDAKASEGAKRIPPEESEFPIESLERLSSSDIRNLLLANPYEERVRKYYLFKRREGEKKADRNGDSLAVRFAGGVCAACVMAMLLSQQTEATGIPMLGIALVIVCYLILEASCRRFGDLGTKFGPVPKELQWNSAEQVRLTLFGNQRASDVVEQTDDTLINQDLKGASSHLEDDGDITSPRKPAKPVEIRPTVANAKETESSFVAVDDAGVGRFETARSWRSRYTASASIVSAMVVGMIIVARTGPWQTTSGPAKLPDGLNLHTSEPRIIRKPQPPPPEELINAVSPFVSYRAREYQKDIAKQLGIGISVTSKAGVQLVLVPPGEFAMGSTPNDIDDTITWNTLGREHFLQETPSHRVRLTRPFYIGRYEVSQFEFKRILQYNPSFFADLDVERARAEGAETSRFPVETVTWFDAIAFCNALSEFEGVTKFYELVDIRWNLETQRIVSASVKISGGNGYRLPTEAEWEFACRAGTTTSFHFGDISIGDNANLDGNSPFGTTVKGKFEGRPTPVDDVRYQPNAFGLCHMHGNVWEWCEDHFDPKAYQEGAGVTVDPKVIAEGDRVLRGGAWTEPAWECRSASRVGNQPTATSSSVGFRVVRGLWENQ